MDLNQIHPEIFVGACPQDVGDIDRLNRDFGITAVLNLQTDDDFEQLHIDWPRMEAAYRQAGIEIRRVPVLDFDEDDLSKHLVESVAQLAELLDAGRRVYVHCTAGIGRSASTVIAYQHWVHQCDLDEAIRHHNTRRACYPGVEAIRRATEAWHKKANARQRKDSAQKTGPE